MKRITSMLTAALLAAACGISEAEGPATVASTPPPETERPNAELKVG